MSSMSGFRYFLTLIDDKSRMTWNYLMNQKDEVLGHFKELYAYVKNLFGPFRSEDPRGILSHDFAAFCSSNGILHQKDFPYTPRESQKGKTGTYCCSSPLASNACTYVLMG